MAKQSIIKVIKAKPGNKSPHHGKYANVPMICQTKDCDEEAIIHTGSFDARRRWCWDCYGVAPAHVSNVDARQAAALNYLKSIGVTLH